jgi:dCTP diphosphatase
MDKSIDDLIRELREFAAERDWDQFHNPKNLAMALGSEAGEVLEIFRWLTPEESRALSAGDLAKARDEIGDVLIFVARLADSLGIAPLEAAFDKLEKSREKYPVEASRGNAKKYSEFGK